jgi:hypothetical protein
MSLDLAKTEQFALNPKGSKGFKRIKCKHHVFDPLKKPNAQSNLQQSMTFNGTALRGNQRKETRPFLAGSQRSLCLLASLGLPAHFFVPLCPQNKRHYL